MNDIAPVILVHGAWHGAWCWQPVADHLKKDGRQVLAPDLPGHGNNQLSVNRVTLTRYAEAVSAVVKSLAVPVVLVGHSMAGMVISSVANMLACENTADRYLHRLVYVNAYLPADGDSVFSLVQNLDPKSHIAAAMQLSEDKRTYRLSESDIAALFYNKTPDTQYQAALKKIQPQASLPLSTKISLHQELFSRIRKTVICSASDRVIPLSVQHRMLSRQPADEFIQIDGDHSFFYSASDVLTRLISSQ